MAEKEVIQKIIEWRIRPVLQAHGGDIEFEDYRDNIVWVKLAGACNGCPNALNTLKDMVEHFLQVVFPEIKAVKDKTLCACEEGECSECDGTCACEKEGL